MRPGTWEALRAHLRAVTERHGSGWYQVVHSTCTAGSASYADLEKRAARAGCYSPGPVQPFEGERPFLFFETAEEGKAAPVAGGRR